VGRYDEEWVNSLNQNTLIRTKLSSLKPGGRELISLKDSGHVYRSAADVYISLGSSSSQFLT